MSIAEKIRIYLLKNKISQTWLSEQTRIALPKLNASLNNKRKLNAEEFASIIRVLEIDANLFLKNCDPIQK